MFRTKFVNRPMLSAYLAIAALQAGSVAAEATDAAFYDAALCNPPYSLDAATVLYEAAEKLAKPDTSGLGAAIYKLPYQIGRDGFESDEVLFAGSAVGVLIEGQRAHELAAKYGLSPETNDLMGTSSKGYARQLASALQPAEGLAGPGKVFIVAREGNALNGKTLLACEFIAD
ncbi:hypothetical protein [Sinorhizobium sp. RAC02]|uniref:hypothetical protein n=1 Tax=Sinorhizobium sp. RAC02 TaxID=1842534 RepID=UPI00083D39D5|nr:hypothetical protein [Sinorhizobium sp. RAC02]AOF94409.1 hypothetical protein BSY16_4202 [Sinorhizobium sp. RAC02]